MLVQRSTQISLRRLTTQQPGVFSQTTSCKFARPWAIATSHHRIQSRPATATATNATTVSKPPSSYPSSAEALIIKQRLNRPISPHLSIYQPQITWYVSALNRITGSILSGTFYLFGVSYLIAPLFGWHLESSALAAAFGSLPLAAKMAVKFGFALPFTFHAFNGIRHLVWDMGMQFSNKQIQRTGWAVVGLSVGSAGVLAYL